MRSLGIGSGDVVLAELLSRLLTLQLVLLLLLLLRELLRADLLLERDCGDAEGERRESKELWREDCRESNDSRRRLSEVDVDEVDRFRANSLETDLCRCEPGWVASFNDLEGLRDTRDDSLLRRDLFEALEASLLIRERFGTLLSSLGSLDLRLAEKLILDEEAAVLADASVLTEAWLHTETLLRTEQRDDWLSRRGVFGTADPMDGERCETSPPADKER